MRAVVGAVVVCVCVGGGGGELPRGCSGIYIYIYI